MNFQGRLNNASGAPMAAGTYNMIFRIYSVSTGGTALWTETHAVSASQGVTVTNGGLFSVQLGSVTALPPSIFNTSTPLYLEVELPTPATATSTSPAWTEGAMTPRNPIESSPYAINSDYLDGQQASSFAAASGSSSYIQNGTSAQTANFSISGSGTANILQASTFDTASAGALSIGTTNATSIVLAKSTTLSAGGVFTVAGSTLLKDATNATTAFQIQNASSATLLTADTTNMRIIIGSTTNGVIISANGISLLGTAQGQNVIRLAPEYPNTVLDTGATGNNTGTMTSGYDMTHRENYYNWTTTSSTNQSYDVVVQVPIPSNFSAWNGATPLCIDGYTSDTTNGTITVQAINSNGTTDSHYTSFLSFTPASTSTWATSCQALDTTGYTASGYMTLRIRLTAPSGGTTRVGNIALGYTTSR